VEYYRFQIRAIVLITRKWKYPGTYFKGRLLLVLALVLDALGNGLLLAVLHLAEANCTATVVRPEGTLLPQVHLVEAEEVLHQQTLQPGIHLHVVKVVHRVHIAAAVVYRSLQL